MRAGPFAILWDMFRIFVILSAPLLVASGLAVGTVHLFHITDWGPAFVIGMAWGAMAAIVTIILIERERSSLNG